MWKLLKKIYFAQVDVYAGYTLLRLRESLVRKRYRLLTAEECTEANDAVDVIRKTEVPIRRIK